MYEVCLDIVKVGMRMLVADLISRAKTVINLLSGRGKYGTSIVLFTSLLRTLFNRYRRHASSE